jgi:hypothetical protein
VQYWNGCRCFHLYPSLYFWWSYRSLSVTRCISRQQGHFMGAENGTIYGVIKLCFLPFILFKWGSFQLFCSQSMRSRTIFFDLKHLFAQIQAYAWNWG